ncbi:MAG: hypothetical protein GY835_17190 [bacterium]|nr:hypothetical protein [bacterium]
MKTGILVSLMLLATTACATTIHVPSEQPTTAAGLAAASYGDTVLLASGTYNEYNLALPPGVHLNGAPGGTDNVTIDARGLGRAIIFDESGSSGYLDNLHLIGGDTSFGGALFVDGNLQVTNCHFEDNSAFNKGGAVYTMPTSSVNFTGCIFTNNSATSELADDQGQGGGCYIDACEVSFDLCTFTGNSAVTDGGGLVFKDCLSALTNVTFTGNTTGSSGGGLVCDGSNPNITNCNFGQNIARFGGGMYCLNGASPNVTGGTFSANEAQLGEYGLGGGVYIWDSSSPTLSGVDFLNNISNYGGGVYCDGTGTTTITNCEFRDNLTPTGIDWIGGAGLGIDVDADADVTGCLFLRNNCPFEGGAVANWSNQNPRFENCVFHNNVAGWGGGFYSEWTSTATLANCTFTYNTAAQDGGSICTYHTASLNLVCCIVAYTWQNGAVYQDGDSQITFTCSDIWNNSGGNWAGGIEDQATISNNFSSDPQFCGTNAVDGNVYLQSDSPCAQTNSTCGLLIGARSTNCNETSTETKSWSAIKAMY